MKKGRKFGIAAFGVAAIIGGVVLVNQVAGIGLRVNLSHSAPVGIWRVVPVDTATLTRGELVEACPPALPIVALMVDRGHLERGNCDGSHVTPLLKSVGAVPGDSVTVRQGRAVEVNGQPIPNSQPIPAVPAWPDGTYAVLPGHVWLFSTYTDASFDSRYFGPVPVAGVRGRASPVLIHGNAADMARVTGPKS